MLLEEKPWFWKSFGEVLKGFSAGAVVLDTSCFLLKLHHLLGLHLQAGNSYSVTRLFSLLNGRLQGSICMG